MPPVTYNSTLSARHLLIIVLLILLHGCSVPQSPHLYLFFSPDQSGSLAQASGGARAPVQPPWRSGRSWWLGAWEDMSFAAWSMSTRAAAAAIGSSLMILCPPRCGLAEGTRHAGHSWKTSWGTHGTTRAGTP